MVFKTVSGALNIAVDEGNFYDIPTSTANVKGTITTAGWYEFKHEFIQDGSNLVVKRTVRNVNDPSFTPIDCDTPTTGKVVGPISAVGAGYGGTRNYRFTNIHRKIPAIAVANRVYAQTEASPIKIRNLKRVFQSEISLLGAVTAEANNNKCDTEYNRLYTCRARNDVLVTNPKAIVIRRPFLKSSDYEKYLPKYPTTGTILTGGVYYDDRATKSSGF
jgi:hypothetical protein